MKKGFMAILKAILYFAVYFVSQLVVSFGFMFVISAQMTAESMATGEELDMLALTEQVAVKTLELAMPMTLVAGILALLIYWIIFLVRKKNVLTELEIRSISVKGILPIAILAAAFNVITSVVVSMVPWPQSWMDSYMASSSVIDNSLMAWITAVFMAPVLEEVVFRGFIYTRLKKGLPVVVAAVLTSLAFGAMHGTIIWLIYTFIFGMVLVWVFERFQSLTACILLHMAYNLAGMGLSLIPEEATLAVWILCGVSIVAAILSCKKILDLTKESAEN